MIANKKAMTMMLLMSSMTGVVGSSAFMLAAPIPAHAQAKNQELKPIGMNYNQHFTTFKDAFDLQKVLAGRYTPEQIATMSIEDIRIYTYKDQSKSIDFDTVQDALNSGITNEEIVKGGIVDLMWTRDGTNYGVMRGGVAYEIKGNFSNGMNQKIYLQPYIYEEVKISQEYTVKDGFVGTKRYTIEELTNGKFNSEDWEIVRYNGKEQSPGTTSQEITLSAGQVVTWDMVLKPKMNLTELWSTDQKRVKDILATAGVSTTEYKNNPIGGRGKYSSLPTYPNNPGEFIYVGIENDKIGDRDEGSMSTDLFNIMDLVEDPIVSLHGSLSDEPSPITPSTINPNTPVSLTIHKHLGDPTGQVADGTKKDVDRETISGVGFTLYKIKGLNPKNIDDWRKYASIDISNVQSSVNKLGDGYSLEFVDKDPVTDRNGVARISGLEQGFYWVFEDYDSDKPNRTLIAPFLVALPMTNPTGDTWNYDVHVHPKNQELKVEKEVKDQGVALNEGVINYAIRGEVPALQTVGGSYNRYEIFDDYDEQAVDLNTDSFAVSFVKKNGTNSNGNDEYTVLEELKKDTDYTWSINDKDIYGEENKELNVILTDSGLKKLESFRGIKENEHMSVQLSFDATVKKTTINNGNYVATIPNKASILPPYHPRYWSNYIPTNEVETKFVNYEVYKIDGDSKEVLPGAEFELHRCEDKDAPVGFAPNESILSQEVKTLPDGLGKLNQMNQDGTKSDVIKNSKMRVDGKDKWVTDENGKININGVQVNNFWNGQEQDSDWVYCLVEVKAPKGYELNPKPIKLFSNGYNYLDEGINSDAVEAVVSNYPGNGGFQLPVTGAQGIMWLALGALTIAGVTYLVMGRRRES